MTQDTNTTELDTIKLRVKAKWWRMLALKLFVYAVLPILARVGILDPEDKNLQARVLTFVMNSVVLEEVND